MVLINRDHLSGYKKMSAAHLEKEQVPSVTRRVNYRPYPTDKDKALYLGVHACLTWTILR